MTLNHVTWLFYVKLKAKKKKKGKREESCHIIWATPK